MDKRSAKTVFEGLNQALKRGEKSRAILHLYTDELARLLAYGCDDTDSFIDEAHLFLGELSEDGAHGHVLTQLAARLCKNAVSYFEQRGRAAAVSDFFEAEKMLGARIGYVKNAVADEAYLTFSRAVKNASVSYAVSFATVCEDVYYGRVDYCILPYETSDEGVLSGFMRLIRKYELYPHYVCTCGGEDAVTRFALLGRSPCADCTDGGEAFLKLTFYRPENDTLSRVSAAKDELSLALVKADSFPVSFEDGGYGLELTLKGWVGDLVPFLLYLELDVPECSDKAIYYKID